MIRNFIFHRVTPFVQDNSLQMDVLLFEKCIQFISSRYRVMPLEDIWQAGPPKKGGKPLASLTFDDGYADNIEYAVPILDRYNCKASFYVVTKCVEENIPVWNFLLECLFLHTRVPAIHFDAGTVPENLRLSALPSTPAQRMAYFKKLKACMKKMPVAKKDIVLASLCQQMNDVEVPMVMMNWKDLSSLNIAGHYIGSHTHTHDALTLIEDEAALKEELSLPRQLIRDNLGYLPISLAYPFGFYNDRVKKMSADAGYQVGIASDKHQLYSRNRHNNFEIPRIALCNESWFKTRLRITNRIEQIKSMVPDRLIYRKKEGK